MPGFATSRPAVVESTVFAGDGNGALHALDRLTGKHRWQTSLGGTIQGMNLVVASGIVVVPTGDSTFGADTRSGAIAWRYAAPLDTRENPVSPLPGYVGYTRIATDGETVFIPAWGASVSAVHARTGVARWVWKTEDSVQFRAGSMGARVSGDTVYATVWHYRTALGGQTEQWLLALDRSTGRELWRKVFPPFTGGVSVQGAPVIVGDIVAFSVVGGTVFAVDRFTQALVWTYQSSPMQATVAEAEALGSVIYGDAGDQSIVALNAATGSVMWKGAYGGQATVDFALSDSALYVPVGGDLVVLDRRTGKEVQRIRRGDEFTSSFVASPTYLDGRVYVVANNAVLCYTER